MMVKNTIKIWSKFSSNGYLLVYELKKVSLHVDVAPKLILRIFLDVLIEVIFGIIFLKHTTTE